MARRFAAATAFLSMLGLTAFISGGAYAQSTLDAVKTRGTLVVGVRFDSPPFGFVDPSGKNVGVDIEIAQEFAKRLGTKLELVQVTGQSRIPMLNSSKVDLLLAALTHTREREKAVDFSITYLNDFIGVAVKKGSTIRSVADLKGKSISAPQGTTVDEALKKAVPDVRIVEYQEQPQAFLALRQGLVDAFITDALVLDGFIKTDPGYEVIGDQLAPEPIAAGLRKNDSGWRNTINGMLQDMVMDGTWERIVKKYISIKISRPEVFP